MTFVPVDFIVMDMRSNTSSPINLSDKTNQLLYEYKKKSQETKEENHLEQKNVEQIFYDKRNKSLRIKEQITIY
jgi:hypothetical protein